MIQDIFIIENRSYGIINTEMPSSDDDLIITFCQANIFHNFCPWLQEDF